MKVLDGIVYLRQSLAIRSGGVAARDQNGSVVEELAACPSRAEIIVAVTGENVHVAGLKISAVL